MSKRCATPGFQVVDHKISSLKNKKKNTKEAHLDSFSEPSLLASITLAANVSSVSSGFPQYPAATDGDDSQSSPTSPANTSRLVAGSTILHFTGISSRVVIKEARVVESQPESGVLGVGLYVLF